jgi:hypothetical protein
MESNKEVKELPFYEKNVHVNSHFLIISTYSSKVTLAFWNEASEVVCYA